MNHKLLIFCFFCIVSTNKLVNAQAARDTIGIADFTTDVPGASTFLNLFTEKTVDIFNATGRFFLVDLTTTKSLDKVIQISQENYKGNWINANARINPKIVIVGQLNLCKFVRVASNATPGYKSNVQFLLKIIETESAKIIDSYEFTRVGTSISLTQEGSVQESINNMGVQIANWINLKFPIQLSLIKITKQNNKSVEEVIVNGGSALKLSTGNLFNIIYLDNTFKPPIPQIIGDASLVDVLNDQYSSLKILSGDRNRIKDYFNNQKELIQFKSK